MHGEHNFNIVLSRIDQMLTTYMYILCGQKNNSLHVIIEYKTNNIMKHNKQYHIPLTYMYIRNTSCISLCVHKLIKGYFPALKSGAWFGNNIILECSCMCHTLKMYASNKHLFVMVVPIFIGMEKCHTWNIKAAMTPC